MTTTNSSSGKTTPTNSVPPSPSTSSSGDNSTSTTNTNAHNDNNNNNNSTNTDIKFGTIQISRRTFEAIIYILGWYLFSLSISIYNKWMFGKDGLDFKFPILITSFHQFCLMVLSSLVLYFNPTLRPTVNDYYNQQQNKFSHTRNFFQFLKIFEISILTYTKQILPCAIASAGDIGLSNVSFKFISLSLYTMLKTSSLMFVLMFGLLFRLEKFNWRLVVIVFVMTISVIMMVKKDSPEVYNDNNDTDINSNSNDEDSDLGVILVIGASMMSGLRWSFTQLLLKKNPYTPNSISTIFYISPSMCIILFIIGLIFEGWDNFTDSTVWDTVGLFKTISLMIIPGILAFMMTLSEFKLLTVAQVTTLSIAGIFKELLTIVLSSFIFGDTLNFINILGLIITILDIGWYNYYRYYEGKEQKQHYLKLSQYQTSQDLEQQHNRSNIELRKL
ncbi:triose-phosphate transporter family-domain-containing protein [Scheffersomyces amazonensis]|uniref:triose-phosphate transporter family-domain-containing protein n=1 Tax=Scheffersomyces amazonensis TaxID=1078765 RepID=UPI00315CFABC